MANPNPQPHPENLTPYKPGESGNPAGRPNAGATIREWVNQMSGWSRDDLTKVMEDAKTPVAQRTAARVWLDACNPAVDAIGKPIAGVEFDRIMDRTEGKPSQAISMNANIEVKSEPVVLVHTAPPPVKPNGS